MAALCYTKLWKLLIDRNMKKYDLRQMADVSQTTMAKLSKDRNATAAVLVRICVALNCDLNMLRM